MKSFAPCGQSRGIPTRSLSRSHTCRTPHLARALKIDRGSDLAQEVIGRHQGVQRHRLQLVLV